MTENIDRNIQFLQWLRDLLFSIYFPFLVVSAHEYGAADNWATRLLISYSSHGHPHIGIEDSRLDIVSFLLVWIPAALVFLCVRLLERFPRGRIVLHIFVGIVATAGFPLLCLYSGDGRLLFLEVELIIAVAVLILWTCQKWPVSTLLCVLLLLVHYALWISVGQGYLLVGGWVLLWPRWPWVREIWNYAWFAYPGIGFCSALVWAAYLRQSRWATERSLPGAA